MKTQIAQLKLTQVEHRMLTIVMYDFLHPLVQLMDVQDENLSMSSPDEASRFPEFASHIVTAFERTYRDDVDYFLLHLHIC